MDPTLPTPETTSPSWGWHGYSRNDCQWFLAQPYQQLDDKAVDRQFARDFQAGKAQLRMHMTGVNTEPNAPDIIYACVHKPERQALFFIRVDPESGKPWDVMEKRDALGRWHNPLLGEPSTNDLMGVAFQEIARWHCQSFGPGPVAPEFDKDDPNSVAMLEQWAEARRRHMANATEEATGPDRSGPRL